MDSVNWKHLAPHPGPSSTKNCSSPSQVGSTAPEVSSAVPETTPPPPKEMDAAPKTDLSCSETSSSLDLLPSSHANPVPVSYTTRFGRSVIKPDRYQQ